MFIKMSQSGYNRSGEQQAEAITQQAVKPPRCVNGLRNNLVSDLLKPFADGLMEVYL